MFFGKYFEKTQVVQRLPMLATVLLLMLPYNRF